MRQPIYRRIVALPPGGERLYGMVQGADQNWAEAERLEARAQQEEGGVRYPSCWSWLWHCIPFTNEF